MLAQLVRDLGATPVVRARVTRPPDGYRGAGQPGRWLAFNVRAPDRFTYTHGTWQALLVAGLVQRFSLDRRLPRIGGVTFNIVKRDGKVVFDSSGVIASPPLHPPLVRISEQAVKERVRTAASRTDLEIESLRTFAIGNGTALEAVVTMRSNLTLDEAQGQYWELVDTINFQPAGPAVEGTWVVFNRADRRRWVGFGYAVRTASGLRVVRR
jgi:hypothetical protein